MQVTKDDLLYNMWVLRYKCPPVDTKTDDIYVTKDDNMFTYIAICVTSVCVISIVGLLIYVCVSKKGISYYIKNMYINIIKVKENIACFCNKNTKDTEDLNTTEQIMHVPKTPYLGNMKTINGVNLGVDEALARAELDAMQITSAQEGPSKRIMKALFNLVKNTEDE